MFVWGGAGIWTDWVIGRESAQTLSKQRLRHRTKASSLPFKASDTLPEVTDTEPQDENLYWRANNNGSCYRCETEYTTKRYLNCHVIKREWSKLLTLCQKLPIPSHKMEAYIGKPIIVRSEWDNKDGTQSNLRK